MSILKKLKCLIKKPFFIAMENICLLRLKECFVLTEYAQ